jgi:pimeloyl-ACP methyl ester carboxylesterase
VQPETTYAPLGDDRVAYQVLGDGPDLVLTMGAFGHVDLQWEDPGLALYLRRLASFSRLIIFDRRGTGASGYWLAQVAQIQTGMMVPP